jgi:hypothetical protein
MKQNPELEDRLEDIAEIRTLMERSAKFLSLSGLSGISAGAIALVGSWYARAIVGEIGTTAGPEQAADKALTAFKIASAVLVFSLIAAVFFSVRMARKKDLPLWSKAARAMLIDLAVPLAVGGSVCILFFLRGVYELIAPLTLVFYGLALLNSSRHTVQEIRYLAFCELTLGLIALVLPQYQFWFWATGFGVLHILYGYVLLKTYER